MQIKSQRLLTLVIVVTLIKHSSASSNNHKNVDDFLLKEAEDALSKIDESIGICDNFYEYACGKYKPEIPPHKVKIDELDLIKDSLQEQLNEDFKSDDDDSDPIKNVKTFYANCMNTEMIESHALHPIKALLNELGNWPVITENWNSSSWRWQDVLMKIENMGFTSNYLFEISLGPDFKNSTTRILTFDQPVLGLSKEYFTKGLENDLVQAYHSYQVDLAVIFGANREKAEQEMKDVLLFEKSLADFSLAKEDRRNSTKLYNPIKLANLQKIFHSINLVEYVNIFLQPEDYVDKDEIVIITNQTFFDKLHELLSTTPSRTIANYMMWRASLSVALYLNKEVRNRTLDFMKIKSGMLDFEPRWKECVGLVSSSLPIASSALYVKNHFDEKSRSTANEMVQAIRNEFNVILTSVDWMDEETRKFALSKVDKMEKHVGYPNELVDEKILTNYYANLTVEKDKFLESYLKVNRFHVAHAMKKFRQAVNKTDWETHSGVAIANAYYFWLENSITIPAGILQGAFFNAERPKYMNFGSIGLVIGHEITHGFDDQGRQFDSEGNLANWWREDTKKSYLDKARCIIEQYGNYTEPTTNLKLNGINTQGENIADNGGIRIAYRAYQKWSKENGVEDSLPGMNLTANQHFWLSVAQTWCSAFRNEEIKHRITTGVHSIARFRVIGPLSNLKEFSDDFGCPLGSPMNPENKCKVW